MSAITPDVAAGGEPLDRLGDGAHLATRRGASELEPVTGPLPVVDLEDGHLHVTTRREVTIVSLDGGLDDGLAGTIRPTLRRVVETARAVVLDLDRVTLIDRSALDGVLAVLDGLPSEVSRCVVAGRMSGRLVLERWGVPQRLVVFHSVADALQAREFKSNGYGDGWQVVG